MATMSGPDFHDKHPHAHVVIGEHDRAWVINPRQSRPALGSSCVSPRQLM
jgi:hypothetical protein